MTTSQSPCHTQFTDTETEHRETESSAQTHSEWNWVPRTPFPELPCWKLPRPEVLLSHPGAASGACPLPSAGLVLLAGALASSCPHTPPSVLSPLSSAVACCSLTVLKFIAIVGPLGDPEPPLPPQQTRVWLSTVHPVCESVCLHCWVLGVWPCGPRELGGWAGALVSAAHTALPPVGPPRPHDRQTLL